MQRDIFLKLFKTNFLISAFTFGGGYVVVPMMKRYFVDKYELIAYDKLIDMAAIAQTTPGAIAINISALTGYEIGKLKGVVVSCIAAVLPPCILLSVISGSYSIVQSNEIIRCVLKGMEAGVAAIIVSYLLDMTMFIIKEKNNVSIILLPISFLAVVLWNINVIVVIFLSILLCSIIIWMKQRSSVCS